MTPTDKIRMIASLVGTWCLPRFADRRAFETWQARRLQRFLHTQLPRTAFYRRHAGCALAQLPIVNKRTMMAHFEEMNVAGASLATATATALAGETSRDFTPSMDGITVGLSSGTSGARGVFLTTPAESARWAGIMLARALPTPLIGQLLPGRAPIKVAFFLRANSNLYTTLRSRRIDFRFHDLFAGLDAHVLPLQQQNPTILVAPASILARLADLVSRGALQLQPSRVISVAEVLEPDDRQRIEQAFGTIVHQLYQSTEGFLGYTCEHGTIHLNEEFVHVEPEWLDAARTRFVPIITDFTRTTQHFIRYRLDDVLRVRQTPCPCGRVTQALAAIEGRCDDILWLQDSRTRQPAPLFPDMLRHAITTAPVALPDYRIAQHGTTLHIAVADHDASSRLAIESVITALAQRLGMDVPTFKAQAFVADQPHVKRRRIVCVTRASDAGPTRQHPSAGGARA